MSCSYCLECLKVRACAMKHLFAEICVRSDVLYTPDEVTFVLRMFMNANHLESLLSKLKFHHLVLIFLGKVEFGTLISLSRKNGINRM